MGKYRLSRGILISLDQHRLEAGIREKLAGIGFSVKEG